MKYKLPSARALRAFESAARHQSFTRAAEELHVTQGAVSQQIKQLEQELGFKLFHRLTRKLVLTEEGKRLAKVVNAALASIAETIEQLQADESGGVLTVSMLPSFAVKWLIPRLATFQKRHPEIDLRIRAEERLADLKHEDVDMAIRYGRGVYPGLHILPLMHEEIFPVCSPRLLEQGEPLCVPEDLRHYRLLHDELARQTISDGLMDDAPTWETWLRAAGVTGIDTSRGVSFSRSEMAIQAALEGQGVAIARTSLAMDDLAAGRLVRLFKIPVVTGNAYYLVCEETKAHKRKIRAFSDWLLAEAGLKGR